MAEAIAGEVIQSIQQSLNTITQKLESVSEQDGRWKPSENEWSILQIVSHLNEAIPYWLNEIQRVLASPGEKWGRGLQDTERLAAVEIPDMLDWKIELERLNGLKQHVTEALGTVSKEQLAEENPHRNFEKFGNKPVSFMIEHFIEEHVEKHLQQIQRNLKQLKG